jgi:hypothetical protein
MPCPDSSAKLQVCAYLKCLTLPSSNPLHKGDTTVIDCILGTARIQSYNILEYGPQKTIFLRLGWTLYWVPLLGIVHIPALPEMTYYLSDSKTLWTPHILRKFGHPLHVFKHQKMIYYFMIMFFFSIFLEW